MNCGNPSVVSSLEVLRLLCLFPLYVSFVPSTPSSRYASPFVSSTSVLLPYHFPLIHLPLYRRKPFRHLPPLPFLLAALPPYASLPASPPPAAGPPPAALPLTVSPHVPFLSAASPKPSRSLEGFGSQARGDDAATRLQPANYVILVKCKRGREIPLLMEGPPQNTGNRNGRDTGP